MILTSKLFSFRYEDDHNPKIEELGDTKFSERIVTLEISFLCFEIEWWCIGDAFYGATEFRINKWWFGNYISDLKKRMGKFP